MMFHSSSIDVCMPDNQTEKDRSRIYLEFLDQNNLEVIDISATNIDVSNNLNILGITTAPTIKNIDFSGTNIDLAATGIFRLKDNNTGAAANYVIDANSTNNTNFATGILWDSNDDSDGEYNETDREDLVFAAEINKSQQGAYGVYDYELRVPAKLRDYKGPNSEAAAFYVEIY